MGDSREPSFGVDWNGSSFIESPLVDMDDNGLAAPFVVDNGGFVEANEFGLFMAKEPARGMIVGTGFLDFGFFGDLMKQERKIEIHCSC